MERGFYNHLRSEIQDYNYNIVRCLNSFVRDFMQLHLLHLFRIVNSTDICEDIKAKLLHQTHLFSIVISANTCENIKV